MSGDYAESRARDALQARDPGCCESGAHDSHDACYGNSGGPNDMAS